MDRGVTRRMTRRFQAGRRRRSARIVAVSYR
jgi:hypothetical protein